MHFAGIGRLMIAGQEAIAMPVVDVALSVCGVGSEGSGRQQQRRRKHDRERKLKWYHGLSRPLLRLCGILFARPFVMQNHHSGDYKISIEHFWFRLNG
jgi:hypothetical protein